MRGAMVLFVLVALIVPGVVEAQGAPYLPPLVPPGGPRADADCRVNLPVVGCIVPTLDRPDLASSGP